MDYHSLPRRQLQALCKKHGIPANSANSEMADALTAILKPKTQLHADNSKQLEKRATRSREPASTGTVSQSKDGEEESNMKLQKGTSSSKILKEESNRKPQRVTRGRGSASDRLEAPKSAALNTEKTGELETNSTTKQQETRKLSTRNGASKQSNSEMPTHTEENVDSKVVSPKSDKKIERAGGIVLRRGRVKVRSPVNLSKSPELVKINTEVAVTTKEKGVGMPSSQSCLVDAKKTRKKKRSVTFSDVLEINSAAIEQPSRGYVSENIKEPAKETMPEMQQGGESNLPKNSDSACMAKKVIGTRKASRGVSIDVIAVQANHQISSTESVVKVSKAEGQLVFDAEKTANIEIGGDSDRKRAVWGKKTLNSVGESAAKEIEEGKVVDGVVKADHIEDVPCTRRSRRLTIVPTDAKFSHDMQKATEQVKGQKDHHECTSIAPKKIEGDLPAETSRRSRRKTLAPLELNHVQSSLGSASEQMEKRVSKAKDIQGRMFTPELKDEALESQQKHSELKTCNSIPIANAADVQPIKMEEAISARNLRGSRQKASTHRCITSAKEVSNEMGCQKICSTGTIPAKSEEDMDTAESEKAPLNTSILANSKPQSLQQVSNNAEVELETAKTTVMPRSTRTSSKVSTPPDNGNAVSQEPVFNKQINRATLEGLIIADKAVGKNIQDSEDLDFVGQSCIGQSLENLDLKRTNEPRVEDPVSSTPSNVDIICCNSFLSAFQIETGKGGEGKNQVSKDAISIPCNEEFGYNTCSRDIRTSSTTAVYCATGDSETGYSSPLVDSDSIKPDAAAVKCHEFTEETSSSSPSTCVQQRHEFTIGKDHDVIEQEGHALDELGMIASLTKDIKKKSRSDSPVSIIMQDDGSLDGNYLMNGTDIEISIGINIDEGISASSPAAIVESAVKHQNSIDIATSEQESCVKVQCLTSNQDKNVNMTTDGAADLVEQQPNKAVDLSLCEEEEVVEMKIHGDLQKEQLQGTNEGAPYDGGKGADDRNTTDNQLGKLSPVSPSCSVEPEIELPRESARKAKQRCPRSIYKSARKAKFSVPWENRSLEASTAPPFNKEGSLNSLDQVEKDAKIWGLSNHEMLCDETNSASSEDEESSAETEETLSDTEVCNFNTEVLISNTEGGYSCSEDDTPSESEEDTMFDSEDYSSEMEGELLSGEECYESEELVTSEELSESEDDVGDDFEEYEVSPVSQSVAISEGLDVQYITDGLENQKAELIAASESSLPNDGVTQAEKIDYLALENVTNSYAPDVEPTDADEKTGGQHEELQKTLLKHAATGIQEGVEELMSCNDNAVMKRVQSVTDSACLDSNSLTSLVSLFATPPSKVKEDVECSLALPSIDILESNVSQLSRTLETELNILPESGQEKSTELCSPESGHVIAEVEQHTVDGAKNETELCESVGGVDKELEINDQMAELDQNCCVEELEQTLLTHAATEKQETVHVLMSYNDNTVMEGVQLTVNSAYQDNDLLTSSFFASPPSKVKEDVKGSLAPTSIGIVESNVSQHSETLETELNSLPKSGQEESTQLGFSSELSHEDVIAEVEQLTMDGAQHETKLYDSVAGVEEQREINGQRGELIENCFQEDPTAGLAVVDCFTASPMLLGVKKESNSKSGNLNEKENEPRASESPCLGPCELILESNDGTEMGDPVILEKVMQNFNTFPKTDVEEVQEEPGNLRVNHDIFCGVEEDKTGNVEFKNDLEIIKVSIDTDLDAENGSKDLKEMLDLKEGPTSELTEELMITEIAAFGPSTLAVNDSETATHQELQILHLDNDLSVDDLPQKQNNEDALAFDTAYIAIGTTDSVVSAESAKELELDMVTADVKTHLFSPDASRNLLEQGETILQLERQQDLLTSDVSKQSEIEAIGAEPEVIQSDSNAESLVSQVMANNTIEVDQLSTLKGSKDMGIAQVFSHESLNEVAQTMHCAEIESLDVQVEEVHVESKKDKEAAVADSSIFEISKEESMKQIDLTLVSVRKLRKMCKENQMSAKKKTENETPSSRKPSNFQMSAKKKTENGTPSARKPSNLWMSETNQVHQPNTSMHPRDIPSANKRSALKALSSNIKATPSAAMQTPTAKGSQGARNLMSTYDGNDGTGRHMVTPSPQAPMSSKRDFARSHHR